MDKEIKDLLIKRIDPEKGVKSELDKVVSNRKEASDKQYQVIRSRITSTKSRDSVKYERYSHLYINVKENNYRRVTKNKDVYVDDDGNAWLKGENGKFKEVIESD